MKNINIPEPCSEDWNEMTPNEKGAFCQKCALDVYDFTGKSADEIREVLTLNIAAPVCMRIEPKQLDQLNSDFHAWKMNNKRSYDRAWLFTLLVVFGMTLFSCEEDEEPVVDEYQKIGQAILNQDEEMKIIDPIKPADLKVQPVTNVINESKEIEVTKTVGHMEALLGKPAMTTVVEQPPQILEEVVVSREVIHLEQSYALGGVPMMSGDYNDYLVQVNPGLVDTEFEIDEIEAISGLVYPNPASNATTLQVQMPKRGKGAIELFAMSGQKIRTIHSGRIKKGESEYPIDLTDLETGFYLLVINSGDMKETVKFSKL